MNIKAEVYGTVVRVLCKILWFTLRVGGFKNLKITTDYTAEIAACPELKVGNPIEVLMEFPCKPDNLQFKPEDDDGTSK